MTQSFTEYSLSPFYVLAIVLDLWDTSEPQTDEGPWPLWNLQCCYVCEAVFVLQVVSASCPGAVGKEIMLVTGDIFLCFSQSGSNVDLCTVGEAAEASLMPS